MNFNLSRLWNNIVRVYKILSVSFISILAVFISWFCLFKVAQVTDAIIALGNFGSFHHFVIFVLIGSLWAFFIWYWAQVFYFIEYEKRKDLKKYEKMIAKYTPQVLGSLVLLIISLAFLSQAQNNEPIRVIGMIYMVLAILFIIFVNLRHKIFKSTPLDELPESPEPQKGIIRVISLPDTTKKILFFTTIITSILLVLLTIWPIHLTMFLGDGVTVLILCLCIWLPLLYWIRYFSLKLGFPLYLLLTILIICFSFFNSNKSIRFVSLPSDTRINIGDYTANWLDKANKVKNLDRRDKPENLENNKESDTRIPMIIVLSEGGGIRAAYWSAQFLARIQKEYPHFRDYLFCISGVSGGSFGATVFDGVLNYYDHHPQEANVMQSKITDIIGKDFLSPTIACLFTREMIQLLIPFPIESFDRAKVFEETWEYVWENNLNNDPTFRNSFLSLWDKNTVPPLFINSTQVENGYPVVLSNIRLDASQISRENKNVANGKFNFPRDFYADILKEPSLDVPLSTASLLSARFPFVAPAGTLTEKNDGTISLVDGGYFDNTGANTAYQVLFSIKKWYEDKTKDSVYRAEIKPIIVYLTNGINVPDKTNPTRTLIGQLLAPIETSFQIRDSNTKNNLLKIEDYVNFYNGEFITYSLQKPGATETDIPLGWALSRKVQEEIDSRVEEIDIKELENYIK